MHREDLYGFTYEIAIPREIARNYQNDPRLRQ